MVYVPHATYVLREMCLGKKLHVRGFSIFFYKRYHDINSTATKLDLFGLPGDFLPAVLLMKLLLLVNGSARSTPRRRASMRSRCTLTG